MSAHDGGDGHGKDHADEKSCDVLTKMVKAAIGAVELADVPLVVKDYHRMIVVGAMLLENVHVSLMWNVSWSYKLNFYASWNVS